jgi:hypothetical protein
LRSCEEGDHGEDAAVVVVRLRQTKLRQDAVHVSFDRSLGDPQSATDAGVRASFGHQGEDLVLARGEHVEWILDGASSHDLLDETGVDDGSRLGPDAPGRR